MSEVEYLTEFPKYYKIKKNMLIKKEQNFNVFGYKSRLTYVSRYSHKHQDFYIHIKIFALEAQGNEKRRIIRRNLSKPSIRAAQQKL